MWHPVIRILALLLLAVAVPGLPLVDLLLLTVVLLLLLLRRGSLKSGLAALRRVRWLLFGILLLYAGFTAGEALVDALPWLSREGLLEGLRRSLALAALVLAVALLMAATARTAVAAALAWILRPLKAFGLDMDRFARRLSLTLAAVQDPALSLRREARAGRTAAVEAAAEVALHIEQAAHEAGAPEPALPTLGPPPLWQWIVVLAGVLAFALLPR